MTTVLQILIIFNVVFFLHTNRSNCISPTYSNIKLLPYFHKITSSSIFLLFVYIFYYATQIDFRIEFHHRKGNLPRNTIAGQNNNPHNRQQKKETAASTIHGNIQLSNKTLANPSARQAIDKPTNIIGRKGTVGTQNGNTSRNHHPVIPHEFVVSNPIQ